MTENFYTFEPPTFPEHIDVGSRLLSFFRMTRSMSVLKAADGSYRTTTFPSDIEMEAAAAYYLGGHIYFVSADEAARLTTAGFGDGITVHEGQPPPGQGGGDTPPDDGGGTPTPTDPPGFGEGGFGEGAFGH